jgi:hypothetical protein
VQRLAASALNAALSNLPASGEALGLVGGAPVEGSLNLQVVRWPAPLAVAVGDIRVLVSPKALCQVRGYIRQNARIRSSRVETGGLLWGHWDQASRLLSILDASGPPPDSEHRADHFLCGTKGTAEEHVARMKGTYDLAGFVGLWHTHPGSAARQSGEDLLGMAGVVAGIGQNRRRAAMLIFGEAQSAAQVGVHLYESMRTGAVEEITGTSAFADLGDTFK